jgi:hypothetical protein
MSEERTKLISSDLFAELFNKWDDKISQLKLNASGQHSIPKARINAEIKGIRLCKKHLKEFLANAKADS